MQGKWDIASDAKCYDVITDNQGKELFRNIIILWIIRKVFYCWSFFTKRPWSEKHAENKYFTFSLFSFVIRKNLKQGTTALKFAEDSWKEGSFFYVIHNLLYETKVTCVTKCLKAHVKIIRFTVGYCKHEQKKYIVSCKTSNMLFFINFCKLFLSTNEVLYLQKQPLVSTLQKQLLLILKNIFAVLWSLPEIVCFLWSTSVVLLEYFFGGKGVFNHFQALNTSTKFRRVLLAD